MFFYVVTTVDKSLWPARTRKKWFCFGECVFNPNVRFGVTSQDGNTKNVLAIDGNDRLVVSFLATVANSCFVIDNQSKSDSINYTLNVVIIRATKLALCFRF